MSMAPKPTPAPPPPPAPPPRYTPVWMVTFGWLISLLPAGLLLFSAYGKVTGYEPPAGMPDIGWTKEAIFGLAIIEIMAAVLYLLPYSATLGAIIMTAYIGGAIATHVRIGDSFAIQLLAGILVWLGLALRDARLRNMLPVRSVSDQPAGPTGCFGCFGMLFLTVLIFVGLLLGISNALTDNFSMSRSIVVEAAPKDVFPYVNDFDKWKHWNPFSKPDPDIKITLENPPKKKEPVGKGAVYKWTSEKVGVGTMRIVETEANKRIKINLEFEEPYKNTGVAEFTFQEEGDKTRVTWSMKGQSPYMFKVMRSVPSVMDLTMGKAFEQGLADIKDSVEQKKDVARKDEPKKEDEKKDEKKKGDNNANP
jgi:uncharacterized protein YndB with AHSA1/START domain